MTTAQIDEIYRLREKGASLFYISCCLEGVSYREIVDLLGPEPHPQDRMSPKMRQWWMQQPWVWRPDNQQPIEAPWERVSRELF